MKKILIIQRRMTHYRVPFFKKLRDETDLSIDVLYGDPSSDEAAKNDSGILNNSILVRNKYISFFSINLCWIPLNYKIRKYDLIIIPNEVRIISNFLLIFLCKIFSIKIAFWGHGDNYQSKSGNRYLKFLRSLYSLSVDGWFVYTHSGKEKLKKLGFNSNSIYVLNNSIEIKSMNLINTDYDKKFLFDNFKFQYNDSKIYGLFLGSLYKQKRLDFLLEAAKLVKLRLPQFELLIVGDGPDKSWLLNNIQGLNWIHYFGMQKGEAKLIIIKCAKFIMNPGLVGLNVLESFHYQKPIFTTCIDYHSPEFDYIINGVNGIVADDDITEYSKQVVKYCGDFVAQRELSSGCQVAADKYSLDNMVKNFICGINHEVRK